MPRDRAGEDQGRDVRASNEQQQTGRSKKQQQAKTEITRKPLLIPKQLRPTFAPISHVLRVGRAELRENRRHLSLRLLERTVRLQSSDDPGIPACIRKGPAKLQGDENICRLGELEPLRENADDRIALIV